MEREQFDPDEKHATLRAAIAVREGGDAVLADQMLRYATIGLPTTEETYNFGAERDAHLAEQGVPVEPPRVA